MRGAQDGMDIERKEHADLCGYTGEQECQHDMSFVVTPRRAARPSCRATENSTHIK